MHRRNDGTWKMRPSQRPVAIKQMTGETRSLTAYWRASLLEAQLAESVPRDLRTEGVEVPAADIARGVLPGGTLDALLRRGGDDARDLLEREGGLPVLLCPLVFRRASGGGGPPSVEAIWIPATLDGTDRLLPPGAGAAWIPRAILEPVASEVQPTIGTVAALESYDGPSDYSTLENWAACFAAAQQLCEAVCGARIEQSQLEGYRRVPQGLVAVRSAQRSGTAPLLQLYDEVLDGQRCSGLISRIAEGPARRRANRSLTPKQLANEAVSHSAHFNPRFALSSSQRKAVHCILTTDKGGLLCVTGPPGTGKTTLLHAVIGSLWVNAAVSKSEAPPIIVACGATNQSVRNVIDSLGSALKTEAEPSGPLRSRWLPDVNSYGRFCVAAAKADQVEQYQLERMNGDGLSAEMETGEYLGRAERYFLERCSAWSGRQIRSGDDALRTISGALERCHRNFVSEVREGIYGVGFNAVLGLVGLGQARPLREIGAALSRLDITARVELLLLTTHYWEARWIAAARQEVEERRDLGENFRGLRTTRKAWELRAMVTPAFVSTAAMLPRFFTARRQDKSQPPIDLLILDEASQLSPELGGAALALARRAMVVGDPMQLEPVWSVAPYVDRANVERSPLARKRDRTSWRTLTDRGVLASNGSTMKMSLAATLNRGEESAGVMLTEQRRSVPEIVEFLNSYVYQGKLVPTREPLVDPILPPIGYMHVEGRARKEGQSRSNRIEAEAIAAWLQEAAPRISAAYEGRPVADVVAVLSPFTAQIAILRRLLDRRYPGMIIGTVGSLQGAERDVVIFSSVYDPSVRSPLFFDRGKEMFNVAVSRARDAFFVVGDMRVFDPKSSAPSSFLARALFARDENQVPSPVVPFEPAEESGPIAESFESIFTLEDHRRILAEAFEMARRRLIICSPGMRANAVRADRVDELIRDARARGVEILIYTDEALDQERETGSLSPAAREARELVAAAGAKVLVVPRIHNKSLAVDDCLLVDGSFNWLSANRRPGHRNQKLERSFLFRGQRVGPQIALLIRQLRYHEELREGEAAGSTPVTSLADRGQ